MTFKEKLVRLRKIKSLTQDEFASAVGVSRQAVYKWESGQSYPEVPKLLEIKLLFGISIDDLLDDTFDIELPEKKRKKRLSRADRERIEAEIRREEGFDDDITIDDDLTSDDTDISSDEASGGDSFVYEGAEGSDENAESKTAETYDDDTSEDNEIKDTDVSDGETAESAEATVSETVADVDNAPVTDTAEYTPGDASSESAVPQKKGFFGRIFGKK